LIVRLIVAAVFLMAIGWAARRFDWDLILLQLRQASLPCELAMAVAWLVALFIRPLRMSVLMAAMAPGVRRHYWPIWSADVIAMAVNSIIPMRAGDATMAFVLKQGLGVRAARATSVVIVDRFFDFATVVVMFVVMLAAAPRVVPWAHDVSISLLAVLILLACGMWIVIRTRRFWQRGVDWLFARPFLHRRQGLRQAVHDLLGGLALVDRFGVIASVIVLSIFMWAAIVASYWFGIQAFWPQATIPAAAFAASVVALSFVVPIAPGGFGVFHGAVVLALALFEVPAEPALAFGIVAHAFQMGSVILLGSLSVLWQGLSVRNLIATRDV
jgi:uncharacterized protein (TIRG00374 family)